MVHDLGVVHEFLRVVTHPRAFRRPSELSAGWSFIQAIVCSPGLTLLAPGERHAVAAARTFAEPPHLSGNLLHDAHTAILMREHGIRRIVTRDTDFHRFSFIEPLDPLSLPGRAI